MLSRLQNQSSEGNDESQVSATSSLHQWPLPGASPHRIQRTPDPATTDLQDVRVDHRGRHVRMAEQFLHRPDVIACLQQVSGEGMP